MHASDDKASTSPTVFARNNRKTASCQLLSSLCTHALRSIAVSEVAPSWRPSASPISHIKKCNLQESHDAADTFRLSSHELFLVVQSPSGEMVSVSQKCYHQAAMAVLKSGLLPKVRQSEHHWMAAQACPMLYNAPVCHDGLVVTHLLL